MCRSNLAKELSEVMNGFASSQAQDQHPKMSLSSCPNEIIHQMFSYIEKQLDLSSFRSASMRLADIGIHYMPRSMTIALSPRSMDDAKAVVDNPIMRNNVREVRICSFFATVRWLSRWHWPYRYYWNPNPEMFLNDLTEAFLESCQDQTILRESQWIGLTSGLWKERLKHVLLTLPNLRSICIDTRPSAKINLKEAVLSEEAEHLKQKLGRRRRVHHSDGEATEYENLDECSLVEEEEVISHRIVAAQALDIVLSLLSIIAPTNHGKEFSFEYGSFHIWEPIEMSMALQTSLSHLSCLKLTTPESALNSLWHPGSDRSCTQHFRAAPHNLQQLELTPGSHGKFRL